MSDLSDYAPQNMSSKQIYQTFADALQGVEILTPGKDGYEESLKRFSEAAEKRAVSFLSSSYRIMTDR